jgi:glycosyltransferase involved in cell wall biosynthesis
MRVAVVQRLTMAHGVRGGMEAQAQALTLGLRDRGHDVRTLTTPLAARDAISNDPMPTWYVAPGSYRRYQRGWWQAVRAELGRQHAIKPFDVVVSHSAGALGIVEWIATELRVPLVVMLHGTPLGELHNHLRGAWSPRGMYRLGRLLSQLPLHLVLWRRSVPSVARWIVPSPHLARAWRRETGAPAERITVIPHGIDTAQFRPDAALRAARRRTLELTERQPLVVAAGRLEPEKGFRVALEAFAGVRAAFPQARLLIAGAGSDATHLARRALAVGGTRLTGYLTRDDLARLLAAADVFVMPSLCAEAFPLSIIEALAAGLATIASDGGAARHAITPGHDGELVPPGDAAALTAALRTLLARPERRAALAAAARATALTRFSHQAMVDATEALLAATAAASGRLAGIGE